MNYAELVAAVLEKTNRPDKMALIELSVKEGTFKAHTSNLFRRDIKEIPFAYQDSSNNPTALSMGKIDTVSQLPGFRQLSYWRKYDPATGTVGPYLTQVEPDLLYDRFNSKKLDVFYLAGTALNWASSTADYGHMIGYWKLPVLTPSGFTSWIADSFPFCIINYAASCVSRDTGFADKMKMQRDDYAMYLSEIPISEITSQGR